MPPSAKKPYATIAGWYDLLDYYWEASRHQRCRSILWGMATGTRILDAGVGTGRNIPYYPPTARVDAIDLSPHMLRRAKSRAKRLGARVRFRTMDLASLDFPTNTFATVVATFVLCVMSPEQEARAIREIWQVLKPGGKLLLLDYTLSRSPSRRFFQKLFSPLILALYGTRLDNPTLELVSKSFKIERVQYLHADTLHMIIAVKRKAF